MQRRLALTQPIRWPREAKLAPSAELVRDSSISTITTAQDQNVSPSASSSRCTSPSSTHRRFGNDPDVVPQAAASELDLVNPRTHPYTPNSSKAPALSSPVAILKNRFIHKASSIKFKVRRKVVPDSGRSQDQSTKVPNLTGSPGQDLSHTPTTVLPASQSRPSIPRSSNLSSLDFEPPHRSIRSKQIERQREKGYLHKSSSSHHTFVQMASDQPPVSYSRLQQITTSACEKALGSITSYNHASTEEWNTTIINTILGTLVEETTPNDASGDGQPQPPYKYVVNSTIIQHAPISSGSSSDPAVTGRRGMHAASGAFWSNEKDGMWSYKYSAAENKGFDVVVGVIWIWIG